MRLRSLRLFSCCTPSFRCNFIGWTWMIASPLQKLQFFALGSRGKKEKRILLTPRSLCWVHYSCPRPRMRTDIDLILRWKPLCTSAGLRVDWGLVIGAIKKERVGSHMETFFFYSEENKEVSQTFIFLLKTFRQSYFGLLVWRRRLGLDLAVHFTFRQSRSLLGLFAQRKLNLLHTWV